MPYKHGVLGGFSTISHNYQQKSNFFRQNFLHTKLITIYLFEINNLLTNKTQNYEQS